MVKKSKRILIEGPMSFEEYKAALTTFTMRMFGKPPTMSDDEIRASWERYKERTEKKGNSAAGRQGES